MFTSLELDSQLTELSSEKILKDIANNLMVTNRVDNKNDCKSYIGKLVDSMLDNGDISIAILANINTYIDEDIKVLSNKANTKKEEEKELEDILDYIITQDIRHENMSSEEKELFKKYDIAKQEFKNIKDKLVDTIKTSVTTKVKTFKTKYSKVLK